MPRPISSELLDCLRRANPYTEYRVEISEPNAVRIIRRPDEWVGAPPLVPPMIPANSLSADARGSLILTPTNAALAGFAAVEATGFDLNGEDLSRRVKGAAWTMDAAFKSAKLRNVTARVQRVALAGLFFNLDFELQIYRVTKTPGNKEKYIPGTQQVQVTAFTDYSFQPLLNPAPVIKSGSIVWDGTQKSTLNFDLTNYGLVLENTPTRAAAPDQAGELPRYYFAVRVLNNPKGTGFFRWLLDNTTARTIAGIGTFQRSWWARNNDQEQWVETLFADVPCFAVNVETYPATGQAWYAIDLGKAPAANAIGRVVFERSLPPGTAADLQLSSTGPSSGFAFVKHGDVVAVSQQNYWLSVRLFTDASTRLTPAVTALGIEWRIPLDVSVESIPQLPTREIALPWPKASIPEGKVTVVRTGVRDYLDTASVLGSTQATTKLECDIYLASRHPSVTRDKWLQLERLAVSNREPGRTSEVFTLLSYASKLKKKIPQKVESLNSVHTVTGSTTGAVSVTPALPGTSVSGNEYDGKNYYMRVRSTSNINVAVGFVQTIQGNTGTGQLDFVPVMPSALNVNDVVEVHSGIFATQKISWTDADPADVWDQILSYAGIVPERIGAGFLPRGGKPPRVTDIAPGDATTQAKLKVTCQLTEVEAADELLAQVSAILGGVTMEMPGGQICFVQLFPLRDATGNVTVPLPPVVKVFDKRDYGTSLQTPPGLEKRATVMSATYGVPLTAAAPDSYPKQTTVTVDNDALLWLTQQDLEDFGSAQLPDKIARWLYNTADAGLYLASSITATYVRALSTGLRVFPFNSVEKNPELVPGDSVVILTDQYTDYEPSSGTPLRGMLAVRGVLVQLGAEGRQLAIFVPGLQDNVMQARGGAAGSLTGLGTPLDPPILSGSFLPTGELVVTSQGSPATANQRIAVGTGEPTDAFTRASTPIALQNITGVASGLIVVAGGDAWIKAFAYDGYGNESLVAKIKLTRQGSGTPAPPVAFVAQLNTETDQTVRNLRFSASAGSGGGGTNITYDIRLKTGAAAEVSLATGNGTTLPRDLSIARDPQYDGAGLFLVTDTATGLIARAFFSIPSQRAEVTTVTGQIKFRRTVNFDDGDKAAAADPSDTTGRTLTTTSKESGLKELRRLLAKTLPADPDTLDGTPDGLTYKRPLATYLNANRPAQLYRAVGTDTVTADTLGAGIGIDIENMVINGGGQDGLVGAQAPGWTYVAGAGLAVDNTQAKFGDRSLTINSGGSDSYSQQATDFTVLDQDVYELSGWIKVSALAGGGLGSFLNIDKITGGGSYTILEKIGYDPAPSEPDVGISRAVGTQDWTFVKTVFRINGSGTIRLYCHQGYTGVISGQSWFDGVNLRRVSRVATEGGARGYSGFQDLGALLATAAKESGGVAVNRLLAKTLAADPNDFGGVPDGLVFKKITGVVSSQITPASSTTRFRCKLYMSGSLSCGNGAVVQLPFDVEDFDIGGLHDNVTNNSRITIPAGGDTGAWFFTGCVEWQGSSFAGDRTVNLLRNGVVISSVIVRASSASATVIQVYGMWNAPSVGDYFELSVRQSSGVAVNAVGGSPSNSHLEAMHVW